MANNAATRYGWRWWLPRLALLAIYAGGMVAIALRGGMQ